MSRRSDPFAALADPTRRGVLDLLRERTRLTAGEIAAAFPGISRAAVSQHLKVLRDASLVRAEQRGREWHYTLDAAALGELYREWFARFEPLWDKSLQALKRRVEEQDG